MGETSINLTEGSGKRTQGWDRTVASVLVQQPFVLPGEYPYATYSIVASGVPLTANHHLIAIMAGSSLHVRIRRIWVCQNAVGTASDLSMTLLRLTTAGSGGTDITPAKFDTADAAAGCTAKSDVTTVGTESTVLLYRRLAVVSARPCNPPVEWVALEAEKPIIIPAGTSNGIALKQSGSTIATDTVDIAVEVVETSYL